MPRRSKKEYKYELSDDLKIGDWVTVKTNIGLTYTGSLVEMYPNCIRVDHLFFNFKHIDELIVDEE
ncbi:hypothetical protein SAMN05421743_12159 [Thalassobacillus cyri]|uniref:Uncharacterized protein n=1 Tax=Thalassobacillus cyri TaxID=571932 RepID=A0A1H4H299_9BACI|nr:hypothetical protein [Thalassobacillus cyri]SEB15894.1 hypothetical protein SAMN05421743_12159 [Thalassobacillus cyri]